MVDRFIIRSIPKVNVLFGGGLPRESMVHIYGPFQSGKTFLFISCSMNWFTRDWVMHYISILRRHLEVISQMNLLGDSQSVSAPALRFPMY